MKRRAARCPTAPRSPAHTQAPAAQPLENSTVSVDAGEKEEESWLHRLGEGLGLGAGFLVTEALGLVPGWNDDLLDEEGAPLESIEGAERSGEYNLEKRHKQVLGPKIEDHAEGLEPGMWRDFVSGFGDGATEGPGASYRFEAGIADHFDGD